MTLKFLELLCEIPTPGAGQEMAAWSGDAGDDPGDFVGGDVLSQGPSLHRGSSRAPHTNGNYY